MNYLIAGAAQPLIAIADYLEPYDVPRWLVKNVTGGVLTASSLALLAATAVVSSIAYTIFPALAFVFAAGLATWGIAFGATKLVRFIPLLSEESKRSMVFVFEVIEIISRLVASNIYLPSEFVMRFGIGLLFATDDEFRTQHPQPEPPGNPLKTYDAACHRWTQQS